MDDLSLSKWASWRLSNAVIGCCIEVHRHLGPGLLESLYQQGLCHELSLRKLRFESQKPLPLVYKGVLLEPGYRLDLLIEDKIVVEVKAVERLLPVHEAQVITYLKLTKLEVGLLVNFNAAVLRHSIRRLRLGPAESFAAPPPTNPPGTPPSEEGGE